MKTLSIKAILFMACILAVIMSICYLLYLKYGISRYSPDQQEPMERSVQQECKWDHEFSLHVGEKIDLVKRGDILRIITQHMKGEDYRKVTSGQLVNCIRYLVFKAGSSSEWIVKWEKGKMISMDLISMGEVNKRTKIEKD